MRRLCPVLLLFVLPLLTAQKKPELREAEIEVVEATVQREQGRVLIDTVIRNTGEKPAKRLVVFYELLDRDRKVLSRGQSQVDEGDLGAGEQAELHSQMTMQARAVWLQFAFQHSGGFYLTAKNTGPYVIE